MSIRPSPKETPPALCSKHKKNIDPEDFKLMFGRPDPVSIKADSDAH